MGSKRRLPKTRKRSLAAALVSVAAGVLVLGLLYVSDERPSRRASRADRPEERPTNRSGPANAQDRNAGSNGASRPKAHRARAVLDAPVFRVAASNCGGRVLDDRGWPVERGSLMISAGNGSSFSFSTVVRPGGYFVIFFPAGRDLEDWGKGTVTVTSPGHVKTVFSLRSGDPKTTLPENWVVRHDLVLRVPRGDALIRYRIVWNDGTPADGLCAIPVANGARRSRGARTADREGWVRFHRDRWPAGTAALSIAWAPTAPPFWTVNLASLGGSLIRLPPDAQRGAKGTVLQRSGAPAPATLIVIRRDAVARQVRTDLQGRFTVAGLGEDPPYELLLKAGGDLHPCARIQDRPGAEAVWLAPVDLAPTVRLTLANDEKMADLEPLRFVGYIDGVAFNLRRDDAPLLLPLEGARSHYLWGSWTFRRAPSSRISFDFQVGDADLPKTVVIPFLSPSDPPRGVAPLLLRLSIRYCDGSVPKSLQLHYSPAKRGQRPPEPNVQLLSPGGRYSVSGLTSVEDVQRQPGGTFQAWMPLPTGPFYLRVGAPFMQQNFGPYRPPTEKREFVLDLTLDPFTGPVGELRDTRGRPIAHRNLACVPAGHDPRSDGSGPGPGGFTVTTNSSGQWALPRSIAPIDMYLVMDVPEAEGGARYYRLVARDVGGDGPPYRKVHRFVIRSE